MGSIWGGSAFKFGIYARDNKSSKANEMGRSYSDDYAWYSKLGATEEEAFAKVKAFVCDVALYASQGNLDEIDKLDTLGPAVKWKIAFHYQDPDNPIMVNVFKKAALIAFMKADKNTSYANLYQQIYQTKQDGENILMLGSRVWKSWESQSINIWKMSCGADEYTSEKVRHFLDQRIIAMSPEAQIDAPKRQAKEFNEFIEAPVGSLFYLCQGADRVLFIAQLISVARESDELDGWQEREYIIVHESRVPDKPYTGINRTWSPSGYSTFTSVPKEDLISFEIGILQPFFGLTLDELSRKVDVDIPLENDAADLENEARQKLLKYIPLNQILFGPPGTGKTFSTRELAVQIGDPNWYAEALAKKQDNTWHKTIKAKYNELIELGNIVFTTFHQSFSYEDFIEGIKATTHQNTIHYGIDDGIFKRMCDHAKQKQDTPCVFIIDEINRGNISKIFGELITLLESSKRSGEGDEQTATLPYSKTLFSVPKNVYVIGTMNTADKSLTHLDLALRRRFTFIELMPNPDLLGDLTVWDVNIGQLLAKINGRVEVLLDKEHTIGHSYFMPLLKMTKKERESAIGVIFVNHIIPLLQEYFYDDYEKIALVLNDKDSQNIIQTKGSGLQTLEALFGSQNVDNLFDRRYWVNTKAFTHGTTYQRILGEQNS